MTHFVVPFAFLSSSSSSLHIHLLCNYKFLFLIFINPITVERGLREKGKIYPLKKSEIYENLLKL